MLDNVPGDALDYETETVDATVDMNDVTLMVVIGNPLKGCFLTTRELVTALTDVAECEVYDEVPKGIKSNIWFVIRRTVGEAGQRNQSWDDCVAWKGGHGAKTYHLPNTLVEVRLLDNEEYGARRCIDGMKTVVALNPQPPPVICLHRYYILNAVPGKNVDDRHGGIICVQ